ncbi:MAG: calcium-binding protein, partial [Pseudomonadota bacterium]
FDQLFGRAGSDYLNGEDGNDTLTGGPGDDYKIGGDGEDTARYQYEPSAVYVDLQIVGAQNTLGSGMDTLVDIERVVGTAHDDFLLGDGEDNWLTGLAGDDQMFGRVGDDRLWGGDDNDILEGGLGDDLLFGGDGEDAASYYFATSSVYVWLGATEGYNTVGAGIDTYHDIENIVGSFHSDGLYGDDGNNKIYAGDGNDLLWGYAGIDDLFGGAGNDILVGGASHDYMDGGEGNDWAHYDGAGDLTVDLADKTEQWTGQGTDKLVNIENVRGWMGDDDLRGDTLNNHIMGLSGDDTLYGGGGEDTLNGGFGNDIIYAGLDGPSDAPDGLKDLENPNDVPSGRFEIGDYTGLLDDEIFNTGQLLGSTPSPVVGASAGNLRSGEGGGARSGNGQTVDDVAQLPGSAPDVIKFIGGWGDDQVFDFTPGADKLDFTNAGGVDDFTDLSLNDTNDGVMITNGDNSVLLHDVEQADLSASDFWF